jgi:bifunctional UDP-N-acetylglucosamine pyrophosphorylase/glucosamine-1-phosphate N-acetyltransferase
MKSALPKVLHRIAGRSMVGHVLDNLKALKVAKITVVIAPAWSSSPRKWRRTGP